MATLRQLIAHYARANKRGGPRAGARGATRALKNLGVNQPSGAELNERFIGEAVGGRERIIGGVNKRVFYPQNEAFIDAKIKNVPLNELTDPGEAVTRSGAETHGAVKRTKFGNGYWIGEIDSREHVATRELTKYELKALLKTAPLNWNRAILLFAFGDYVPLGTEQDPLFGSDAWLGENVSQRRYIKVALKQGYLLYERPGQGRVKLRSDWQATEAQVTAEILEARRAARDLARFGPVDPRQIERQITAIERGGWWNGMKYPSFAARFMTVAGDHTWLRVHAAEVRRPG